MTLDEKNINRLRKYMESFDEDMTEQEMSW
jgi:hypothetical protein